MTRKGAPRRDLREGPVARIERSEIREQPVPGFARASTRATAAQSDARRGPAARPELRLEGSDARLQGLVLLAGKPRHVLDSLELLALDQVEIGEPALGLGAEHGLDLAADTLRDAGGIVHQPRNLVEEAVAGLGHARLRARVAATKQWRL